MLIILAQAEFSYRKLQSAHLHLLCFTPLPSTSHVGHVQALPVGAQAEAGLSGAHSDRPEEAEEEKPGEALIQVRDQRERGE